MGGSLLLSEPGLGGELQRPGVRAGNKSEGRHVDASMCVSREAQLATLPDPFLQTPVPSGSVRRM